MIIKERSKLTQGSIALEIAKQLKLNPASLDAIFIVSDKDWGEVTVYGSSQIAQHLVESGVAGTIRDRRLVDLSEDDLSLSQTSEHMELLHAQAFGGHCGYQILVIYLPEEQGVWS